MVSIKEHSHLIIYHQTTDKKPTDPLSDNSTDRLIKFPLFLNDYLKSVSVGEADSVKGI